MSGFRLTHMGLQSQSLLCNPNAFIGIHSSFLPKERSARQCCWGLRFAFGDLVNRSSDSWATACACMGVDAGPITGLVKSGIVLITGGYATRRRDRISPGPPSPSGSQVRHYGWGPLAPVHTPRILVSSQTPGLSAKGARDCVEVTHFSSKIGRICRARRRACSGWPASPPSLGSSGVPPPPALRDAGLQQEARPSWWRQRGRCA